MKDHERFRALLAVPRAPTSEEQDALTGHLESCAECRRLQARYARQDGLIRSLHASVPRSEVRRAVHEHLSTQPRRRWPGWRRLLLRRLPETVVLGAAALIIIGLVVVRLHAAGQSQNGTHASVPPAARALARRLGIHGTAFVGNAAGGGGRPWTVWFPRAATPVAVGPGNVPRRELPPRGRALLTGPNGAAGEFHYFDSSPLSAPGRDRYRGARLTRGRATTIALAWLHRAGVPIPHEPMHVMVASGTTNIGGTGLCCFTSLATVYWGRQESGSFVTSAQYVVYVADGGTVVQADIGAPAAAQAEDTSYPCKGDRRDANGVPLGPWCFQYGAAARGIIFAEIGGHDGEVLQPDYAAFRAASRRGANPHASPHRILLTTRRAVYTWRQGKTVYRVTVVPAFPGLIGSTWEVQRVQRDGT